MYNYPYASPLFLSEESPIKVNLIKELGGGCQVMVGLADAATTMVFTLLNYCSLSFACYNSCSRVIDPLPSLRFRLFLRFHKNHITIEKRSRSLFSTKTHSRRSTKFEHHFKLSLFHRGTCIPGLVSFRHRMRACEPSSCWA